jgi:hypothetical protein
MRLKNILSYFILLILFSCIPDIEDDDKAYVGIGIDIGNLTNIEYDNVKLHIGGLKDSTFISTDIFELPTIIVRPNESFSQVVTFGEKRWQTDLEKINKISNQAYFALEFEDGQIIKVKEFFEKDPLLTFSIIDQNNEIKNKYGGRLIIAIRDEKVVSGNFFEDTKFRQLQN